MSVIQNKAAHVRAPIVAQAYRDSNNVVSKQYGTWTLTGSTTSTAFNVPDSWKGCYMTLLVSGSARMQMAFTSGSTAPTLTWNASNPPDLSGSFARGKTFLPDQEYDFVIPQRLNFRTSFSGTLGTAPVTKCVYLFENLLNQTGSVEISVSEGPAV